MSLIRRKKPRRRYSDEQVAETLAVLDSVDGNISETVRVTGVPDATLDGWIAQARTNAADDLHQAKKRDLADMFEQLARVCVDAALRLATHEKTSLAQAATAAGIAIDKMQLLRGKATSIEGKPAEEQAAEALSRLMGCSVEEAQREIEATTAALDNLAA